MTVEILGRHTSYNVQKVLWLVEELDLEYVHKPLGGKHGGLDTAEFGALNPMRKVPVLKEGDRCIWESNTILRYLAEAYGKGTWKVEDPYLRSEHERWMDWSQTKFDPAFTGVFWGYYRTPPARRNMRAVLDSKKACEDCLEKLDHQLAGSRYLTADHLSLADIAIGVFLYRLAEIDLETRMPQRVRSWYERLQTSPGYRKWVMSDFSELEGRLEY